LSEEEKLTMKRTFAFPVAVTAGLLGGIVAGPAYAAGMTAQTYSSDYDKCMDKSGGVTADMLDCASAELSRQDKKLNAAYQTLMRKSTEEEKTALRDSQRGWLAYRTASCKLTMVFGGGGTMDLIAASSCNLDETARRVFFLESLLVE
jgi:uncharacterized protein YecT (DUF1311 family)